MSDSVRMVVQAVVCALVLGSSVTHAAQARPSDSESGSLDAAPNALWAGIEPPPPELPAVITRDETGRATIRAVRITEPPRVDGRLDEEMYQRLPAISGFVQQDPAPGAPGTERTEIWILFDDRNIYISARLFQDPARIVGTELRRDHQNVTRNDNFTIVLDTFRDRRSSFNFQVSAGGGFSDGHVTDERENNREWNTVWEVKTGRFAEGWTVEVAIPFRSLRYGTGRDQIWGINFRRLMVAKNELATLVPVPASYNMPGVFRVSLAATLVGLQVPTSGKGLEIKPYALSSMTTDRTIAPSRSNDPDGELGLDVKYSLTRGLTLDATYNTDFAQVEEDEQQVNLTRFSLFFPERRDFFLEGQGIFGFGGVRTTGTNAAASDVPVLFFSRRIGLFNGRPIPILAGGRVSGRAGQYSIGALNIQTEEDDLVHAVGTNFTVLRARRDIFERSYVGVVATNRSESLIAPGSNQAVGVDSSLLLHDEMAINTFYAITRTAGRSGGEASYRAQLDYPADRYGLQLEHLTVGENFNPEVGFLRRRNFRRNFAQARFSPRPERFKSVRKFVYQGSFDYVENTAGRPETREAQAYFQTQFQNSDSVSAEYTHTYEFLPSPFEISDGVILPIGPYTYHGVNTIYVLGPQRPFSGTFSVNRGTLYSGDRTEATYTGRVEMSSRLSFEPRIAFNWVDLPEGAFTTRLIGTRVNLTFTPRMAFAALMQYNSTARLASANLRFHWEYQPGSDFYIVYNEGRDTLDGRFRYLQNRSFTVKLTRLFRF